MHATWRICLNTGDATWCTCHEWRETSACARQSEPGCREIQGTRVKNKGDSWLTTELVTPSVQEALRTSAAERYNECRISETGKGLSCAIAIEASRRREGALNWLPTGRSPFQIFVLLDNLNVQNPKESLTRWRPWWRTTGRSSRSRRTSRCCALSDTQLPRQRTALPCALDLRNDRLAGSRTGQTSFHRMRH